MQLAGELFNILAGTRMNHVPYRGAGPAMQDLVAGYALFAPKGTPPEIIEKMPVEVRKAPDSDTLKDIWAKNGSATPTLMGAEFGKFVNSEIKRSADVVQKAGIKPE